ncbi:hypothetical protein [Pseudoalteromonas luteoviolacea]|uniref:Metallo-beta-lactamase domain-containing protein n=1 Tax=Pseudoalteromonas luteoviolacea S4054 TaxID=1129367 RepID=A0A0F6AEW9_9GAMM|nr:hypothetical protein [Pseudoalteromonas luteoviolacea]AOT09645.1 hypothetical protein S4054249_18270 [Pseudoalteromonas luteoviolacea]AOT14558.1 hypothetical protein S40542_18240 [Pseudoalteromonas luteoviolacea]AOT19472.1 hypothetical protein S4054_18245 [Pseudoalteromonas luteoviolacea]KKE83909.1 hypothetical protein N479_10890 [Pseudoalteromonas luteoviolacea S4054]KZN77303.1 hypothetical protein N481_04430 [Pseudoalteromonas luteoviolacea S4047-1]
MPIRIAFSLFYLFMLSPIYANAASWHHVDKHTVLIEPTKEARYLIPNQAIIQGDKCAALIDSHGDFVALELLVAQIRSKLTVPLCYIVATNLDPKQLSGTALLKSAFPNAVIYTPEDKSSKTNSIGDVIKQELDQKLAGFEQSLLLSQQRISHAPELEQLDWHTKLQQAKQRLSRWHKIPPPTVVPLSTAVSLELGNYSLTITPIEGYKGSALYAHSHNNQALFGGHTTNALPYIAQAQTVNWQKTLHTLKHSQQIKWILPGYGKPYKKEKLHLPIRFLSLLNSKYNSTEIEELRLQYQQNGFAKTQFDAYFEQAEKQKKHTSF